MPIKPSLPISRTFSSGNSAFASIAAATGAMRLCAKSRAIACSDSCSSVKSKSMHVSWKTSLHCSSARCTASAASGSVGRTGSGSGNGAGWAGDGAAEPAPCAGVFAGVAGSAGSGVLTGLREGQAGCRVDGMAPAAGGTGGAIAPPPSMCSLRWFAEAVDELVGMAADRRIEDLELVCILWIAKHVAFAVKHEAGRLDLLAHDCGIDAVQRGGVLHATAHRRGVVDDHEQATRLERRERLAIELGRIYVAEEIIRIVVVILRGEHQVHRHRRCQLRGR